MGQPIKLLAIGPPAGRVSELVAKLAAIKAKHGEFHALLVLGDFWSDPSTTQDQHILTTQEQQLLDGDIELPLPTFFFTGSRPLPDAIADRIRENPPTHHVEAEGDSSVPLVRPCQVAKNLFFLGKYGVSDIGSLGTDQAPPNGQPGLRVAFLGGGWDVPKWAESVASGGAPGSATYRAQTLEDMLDPYITSHCVAALLAHPSFRTPVAADGVSSSSNGAKAAAQPPSPPPPLPTGEPTTLAEARRQMQAQRDAEAHRASQQQQQKVPASQPLQHFKPPIDMLLTTSWPNGITLFSDAAKLPHPTARMWGCSALTDVAAGACARYHFALAPTASPAASSSLSPPGSLGIVGLDGTLEGETVRRDGVFWEREPYRNNRTAGSAAATSASGGGVASSSNQVAIQQRGGWAGAALAKPSSPSPAVEGGMVRVHPACVATRFLSLARFANASKARWFMALNLVPALAMDADTQAAGVGAPPANATLSPFERTTAGGGGGPGGPAGGVAGTNRKRETEAAPEVVNPDDTGANYRWQGMPTRGKRPRRGGHDGVASQRQPAASSSSSSLSAPAGVARAQNGAPSSAGAETPRGQLPARPNVPLPPGVGGRDGSQRPKVVPVGPQDCWFCLSNPQCAKHLIVSIGTECYVALPKGQLPPTEQSPVPGGGHVLIVPVAHVSSLLGGGSQGAGAGGAGAGEGEAGKTGLELSRLRLEMARWRQAVRECFASFGCAMAAWEVCRRSGGTRAGHMQAQAVPVPYNTAAAAAAGGDESAIADATGSALRKAFAEAARAAGYRFVTAQDEVQGLLDRGAEGSGSGDYVRLDLAGETWFLDLEGGKRFNMQFPRQTLATYLGVGERADWKACARGDKVEEAETAAFREAFQEFAERVEAQLEADEESG